jgi:hypothetical protein
MEMVQKIKQLTEPRSAATYQDEYQRYEGMIQSAQAIFDRMLRDPSRGRTRTRRDEKSPGEKEIWRREHLLQRIVRLVRLGDQDSAGSGAHVERLC